MFRELIENLVHASFAGVVITILDGGNTLRVSDQGPGIPDKEAALRPGFTSADADAKRYIRGVGSGFSVVSETLAGLGGDSGDRGQPGQRDGRHGPGAPAPRNALSRPPRSRPIISPSASLRPCC